MGLFYDPFNRSEPEIERKGNLYNKYIYRLSKRIKKCVFGTQSFFLFLHSCWSPSSGRLCIWMYTCWRVCISGEEGTGRWPCPNWCLVKVIRCQNVWTVSCCLINILTWLGSALWTKWIMETAGCVDEGMLWSEAGSVQPGTASPALLPQHTMMLACYDNDRVVFLTEVIHLIWLVLPNS